MWKSCVRFDFVIKNFFSKICWKFSAGFHLCTVRYIILNPKYINVIKLFTHTQRFSSFSIIILRTFINIIIIWLVCISETKKKRRHIQTRTWICPSNLSFSYEILTFSFDSIYFQLIPFFFTLYEWSFHFKCTNAVSLEKFCGLSPTVEHIVVLVLL